MESGHWSHKVVMNIIIVIYVEYIEQNLAYGNHANIARY